MKELGKNISAYWKKAGITQERLAELMLGDEKKAISLAWKLPSMNGSMENMLCEVSSGKNKVEFNQIRTCVLLMLLYQAMVQNASVTLADGSQNVTDEEELAILQKFEEILRVLFEKEDYGFFHTCLQSSFGAMATGNLERQMVIT